MNRLLCYWINVIRLVIVGWCSFLRINAATFLPIFRRVAYNSRVSAVIEAVLSKSLWIGKFNIVKISIASAVMGVSCLLCLKLFNFNMASPLGWKLVGLFGTIAVGLAVYLGTAFILRAEELGSLLRLQWPGTRKTV